VIKCLLAYLHTTGYFNFEIGVRQLENLSPFLFSLFLNDLEECLLTKDIVDLRSITYELETELEIYLKIFVMLYADCIS
jgi:hypothetical protein